MDTNVKLYKYGRTPHLPFSETITDDDKRLLSDEHFYKMDKIVVTKKMDGENTTIYPNGYCHARSLDSKHLYYHSWLLSYIRQFCYNLPPHTRVCGEYLYATHSIHYDNLESYFLGFSVWEDELCYDFDKTMEFFKTYGIPHVPVLYTGKYDRDIILDIAKKTVERGGEGIVVRNASSYNISDMGQNIAKYVRANHVQTDKHWAFGTITPNTLKK